MCYNKEFRTNVVLIAVFSKFLKKLLLSKIFIANCYNQMFQKPLPFNSHINREIYTR